METLAICRICEKEIAKNTCMFCGRAVCNNCYTKKGLCKVCKNGKRI